jgi:hypothetical protein
VPGNPFSFGSEHRYYGSSAAPDPTTASSRATAEIVALLKEYDPELERRVSRSFRQWNNVLRDQPRNEMGLRLSIGDETQAVPARVVPGFPAPFRDVLEGIPPGLWRFLLRLPALEATVKGLDSVIEIYSGIWSHAIPNQVPPSMSPSVADAREFCDNLLSTLQRIEIGQKLGTINEDILGAYFFRLPEVHVYWMVIGLVAGVLGISAESLTVVVATHELAHAYSHLGRDIDGKKWETEAFARADLNIVEGIAQFYTEVVSRKLETRNPSVLPAYEKLTEIQRGPYRVHEEWAKRKSAGKDAPMPQAGEIVRATLVQCRSRQVSDYRVMQQIIESSAKQLAGSSITPERGAV